MQQTHHHMTARDWDKLANDPEFLALKNARRRFIIPATIFCLAFYLALPLSIALAPDFMSQPTIGPLTRAFTFAIIQFLVAWLLLALYLREANIFDDRAEAIAKRAHEEFAK
jgi:uncharacterized membrane protein (DUF485 family)